MFIHRLVLENVRSIEYLDIPFEMEGGNARKWTFILGENGTGKSSILRSIALLLAGGKALPELVGETSHWIRNEKKSCRMCVTIATSEEKKKDIEIVMERGDDIQEVFRRNEESLAQLKGILDKAKHDFLTVGYGVSRRLSHERLIRGKEVFRQSRANRVATIFNPDATLNSLNNWAMKLDYNREDGIDILRNALDDLLPNMRFESIDKKQGLLMFDTPDGLVSLDQLSDGYQTVASWLGDLLYRITEANPQIRHPLQAKGLLLMDELGLHLHPTWQRELIGFLTKKLPNFQIITTTHSPLTVHQAGENELFILRREKNSSPSLIPYEGAPRNLLLHQLLMSPIFGLTTMHSKQNESIRTEYKNLRSKKERSPSEDTRLESLQKELAELPDYTSETPRQRKQQATLQEIQELLKNREKKGGES